MGSHAEYETARFVIPPRQNPYATAYGLVFEALNAAPPSEERLAVLGGCRQNAMICLPIVNRGLLVDCARREVFTSDGNVARRAWGLLALHYLCAEDLAEDTREVSFSHFSESRGYISVFQKRIIGRFLATTGRSSAHFIECSEQLSAVRLPGPGIGYRFSVLPRVPIAVIRHDDDGELGPDATIVFRADIEQLLPPEDRVVAVELLLDALAGKSIDEKGGGA